MVAPHPPSVPALTWSWRGGVGGTWNVGVAEAGLTVVEPRSATPLGGVQVMVMGVGVPLPTKVTTATMAPGAKSTNPGRRAGLPDHRGVGGDIGEGGVGRQGVALGQVGGRRRLGVRDSPPHSAAPPDVRPFSLVVCELTVSEVSPRPRKWLMTDAGMVIRDPSVVWKVPPASMLAGGAVDADTTVGKLVVVNPGTVHE